MSRQKKSKVQIEQPPEPVQDSPPKRVWKWPPLLLFLVFFGVYSANPDFSILGDIRPSIYQALHILNKHEWTFTPASHPFLFQWHSDSRKNDFRIYQWDPALKAQYEAGTLKPVKCGYYVVASSIPGRYVNFFGVGPALMLVPVYAVAQLLVPDLAGNAWLSWFLCKETAAALVAGSAALIYLAALSLTKRRNALVIAVAYGLGTCVWSTCSQGMWQQTPNVFFLALGTLLFFRIEKARWLAVPCGVVYALAVWCRPTSAVVVVCVGVYLLLRDRRALIAFALAGLPFAVALAFYNYHYLGSPFAFGQDVGGRIIAVSKTGSNAMWQTPLFKGLLGLLVSPSRGLFVYSPFLLLAIPGMVRIWSAPRYAVLRPLLVAVALVLCVEAKHFDWWAGWSFGYRHVLDMTVFLSLMLIPVMDTLWERKLYRGMLAAAVLFSVGVQVVGITASNGTSWNNREATKVYKQGREKPIIVLNKDRVAAMRWDKDFIRSEVVRLDIDKPENRRRLWSLRDSQLVYLVSNYTEARIKRHQLFDNMLKAESRVSSQIMKQLTEESKEGEDNEDESVIDRQGRAPAPNEIRTVRANQDSAPVHAENS